MTTTAIVLFVAGLAALAAVIGAAISVLACSRTLRAAGKQRSTNSMQGELLEIRDYLGKLDRWAKRINAREVMQERRDDAPTSERRPTRSSTLASITDKDELRKIAGIVPGRAPPHRS